MTTLEKVLTRLEEYPLGYKTRVSAGSFTGITFVGTTATVTFSSTPTCEIGNYICITDGINEGYHVITAKNATTITYTDTEGTAQAYAGNCIIYRVKTSTISAFIAQNTNIIQDIIGMSISTVDEYTEVHDGNGYQELLLDRKPITALVSIQVLMFPYGLSQNGFISIDSMQVYPEQGLIRAKTFINELAQPFSPVFPKGRNNIKVTYTAGFDGTPSNVLQALVLATASDVLGDQAGRSGDAASLTVVSWSKSHANPLGKYGVIRQAMINQAKALLRPYRSGVVG